MKEEIKIYYKVALIKWAIAVLIYLMVSFVEFSFTKPVQFIPDMFIPENDEIRANFLAAWIMIQIVQLFVTIGYLVEKRR